MKTALWILLAFIIIYAATPSSGSLSIASQPGFVFDKDKLLEDFNNRRRAFAKEKNFAKMFKLEWDEELAKRTIGDNETELRYFYDMPKDSNKVPYMERQYDDFLKNETDLKEYAKKVDVGYFEVLLSGQKKIGCAAGDYGEFKSCDHGKCISGSLDGLKCILSPEKDFEAYDSHKGEAGSQCEFFDYVNDDGLCAKSSRNLFIIIGCAVAAVLAVIVIVVVVVFCILRRKKKKAQESKTTGTGTATGTTMGTTPTGTNTPATTRY